MLDHANNLRIGQRSDTSGLTVPRYDSTDPATGLPDNAFHGQLILDSATNQLMVYDVETDEWAVVSETGTAANIRVHHGIEPPWPNGDITHSEQFGDLWYDQDAGNLVHRWNGTTWVELRIDIDAVDFDARELGATKVHRANIQPADAIPGDLWFDTNADENEPKWFNGTDWLSLRDAQIGVVSQSASDAFDKAVTAENKADQAQSLAEGAIRTYYQETPPWADGSVQPAEVLGDMWFKTSTAVAYRWDGTNWVIIPDTAISEALDKAQGAQTTADGKITAYYDTIAPWANGDPAHAGDAGDIWFNTGAGNKPNYYTGSVWSDLPVGLAALANDVNARDLGAIMTTVGSTQPVNPKIGDLWVDTTVLADGSTNVLKRWDGDSWEPVRDTGIQKAINDAFDAGVLADAKMRIFYRPKHATLLQPDPNPPEVDVGDLWYNTSAGNKAYHWTGTVWSDLPVGTGALSDGAVTGPKVTDGAITGPKIATDAVGTTQISAGAITSSEIADLAVNGTKLADLAVSNAKLVNDAVTSVKLANDAVTASKIATGAVTNTKLVDDAVTAAKIAANAVTTSEIAANAVNEGQIAAGAVGNAALYPSLASSLSQVYYDDFSDVSKWVRKSGGGSFAAVTVSDSQTGSSVGRITGVESRWARDDIRIPYDPNTLYRMRIRVRENVSNSATVRFYAGYTALNADGAAISVTGGLDAQGNQHYQIAAQADVSAGPGWTEYVGYVKGVEAAGVTSTNSPSTDPKAPRKARNETRWIRPFFIGNISGTAADVQEIDLFSIEVVPTGVVEAGQIAASAVGNAELATNAVTSGKVAAAAITSAALSDAAVTAAKIAAGAVGNAQIGNLSIDAAKLADGSVSAVKIVNDAVTSDKIVAGAIGATELAANSVIAGKIAASAVTANEVAAGAITAGKIAADAVTATAIAADAVTASKIAAGAVAADEIAAGAVVAGKIAAGVITATELATGSVTAIKVAADAITADKIAANAVTASELAAGSVVAGKIAANAITATELTAGAVTAGKIAADAVTANEIAANAITASEIAADAVTSSKIFANSVTAGKIATDAVTADKIAANAVTASEIAAGAVNTDKLTVGSVTDNLAFNPGFEDWTGTYPDRWTCDGSTGFAGATYVKSATGAQLSQTLSLVVTNAASSSARAYTTDYAPCTPGEQVFGSALCKGASAVSGNAVAVGVFFYNASGTYLSESLTRYAITTGVQRLTAVATAPASAVRMRVQVRHEPMAAGVAVTWDDVELRKTVGSALISDAAIIRAKIADLAVDSAKIADLAVTNAKIDSLAVTSAKIANLAVDNAKIANLAVTEGKIDNLAVTNAKISSLDAAKITTGLLDAARINTSQLVVGTNITQFAANYDPTTKETPTGAQTKAETEAGLAQTAAISDATTKYTQAKDRVAGWVYPGQTTINGGEIQTETIQAKSIGAGEISVDKLSLGAAQGGLLRNGGFEDTYWTGSRADPIGWTPKDGVIYNGQFVGSNVIHGTTSLSLTTQTAASPMGSMLSDPFAVVGSEEYIVDSYMRLLTNPTTGWVVRPQIFIEFLDSAGAMIGTADQMAYPGSGTGVQAFRKVTVSPPTAVSARIRCTCGQRGTTVASVETVFDGIYVSFAASLSTGRYPSERIELDSTYNEILFYPQDQADRLNAWKISSGVGSPPFAGEALWINPPDNDPEPAGFSTPVYIRDLATNHIYGTDPTFQPQFPQGLNVTATGDAKEDATDNSPFKVGNPTGSHLRIDGNEIISMASATARGQFIMRASQFKMDIPTGFVRVEDAAQTGFNRISSRNIDDTARRHLELYADNIEMNLSAGLAVFRGNNDWRFQMASVVGDIGLVFLNSAGARVSTAPGGAYRPIAASAFNVNSDPNQKSNVSPVTLSKAINTIRSLEAYEYDRIEDGMRQRGLMATEIRNLDPVLVHDMDDGDVANNVDLYGVTATLVVVLKEAVRRIIRLETEAKNRGWTVG